MKEKEKARIAKERERERAARMKEKARIALEKAKAKEKARKEKEAARAKAQKEKEEAREKAQKEKELAKQKAREAKLKAQELLRAGRGRPGRPAKRDRDAERALLARAELKPEDAEARRTRLKNLIKLGKERGYLTYAEVNDHLPDDMVDAEQIESIISTFNDMSIQVYDEAPDAETLLITENAPAVVPDEDAEEEAEAALSTVDPEFGRTTDPVRMYMREMGSVELLTREGEIEIAKRIEDGLKHMIQAISACPTTIAEILELVAKVERDEMRIDELVDGLIDPNAKDEPIEEIAEEAEIEEEIEESEDEAAAAVSASLLQLKQDALVRFDKIRRLYDKKRAALAKHGHRSKEYIRARDQISNELLDHPLHRAHHRAAVRLAARHGRRGAPPRARDHAPVREQGHDAASAFHQGFSRQRDEPALGEERDRRRASVEQRAHALRAGDPRTAAEADQYPEAHRHSAARISRRSTSRCPRARPRHAARSAK